MTSDELAKVLAEILSTKGRFMYPTGVGEGEKTYNVAGALLEIAIALHHVAKAIKELDDRPL